MEQGSFKVDGQPFHPMVLNYIVNLQTNGRDLWPAPYQGYTPGYRFAHGDRDSCLLQIRSDLRLMREMGFNTVRIVKLAEGPVRDRNTGGLFIKAFVGNKKDTLLALDQDAVLAAYHLAIDDVVRAARENDMRIILLTSLHAGEQELEAHWKQVVSRLRDESAILAFDLFNEPLYFDSLHRTKEEVYHIVKRWRGLMHDHAPDRLFTLGLQGVREVFEWDPNILDVDFISFHPYEYEPDQVRNELRWYHEQVRVPWIIGETSLPADNDSVPYSAQLDFARRVLAQCHACGGIGFSWWQYKDVEWGEFHSDHMGVLSLQGSTQLPGIPLAVVGTPKPVVEAFREFDPGGTRGQCLRLPNYANFSEHTASRITGRLLDTDGRPIAGGVVIGWNEWWSRSFHTVSDDEGRFVLKGDMYFHHWMATASCHDHVRDDCPPAGFLTGPAGVPEFKLGDLVLKRLSVPCADGAQAEAVADRR
jgi:hypothetical protein